MILNDDGTYDSMSEGEMEALEQVAMHRQVNNEDEDDQVFCDEDSSPALVVSKVLTLQHQQDKDQRCHIFHTKAGINGRSVKVIIDGGSCHNLASEELCSKLQLVKMKHPHPYTVQWLSDTGTLQIEHRVQVSFNIGAYEDTLECDVIPMTVCHLLLGRPFNLTEVSSTTDTQTTSFKMKGREFVLRPMSPSQVLADKQATHRGENSERANHQKESERHKPKFSASTMSDKTNLVLFATKREMREVCENPSSVLHMSYCARTRHQKLTPLTIYLWCSLLYCKNFKMFSPMSYLQVYLHYEASSTASTSSPERHIQTRLPTESTPKKPKKYKGK